MATVSGEMSFYILRFLLGAAEAGFFPGIILYLTYWYPAEYRGRFLAAFAIAVPVSNASVLILDCCWSRRHDGPEDGSGCSSARASPRCCLVPSPGLLDRPEKADWLTQNRRPAGKTAGGDRDQAGGKTADVGEALSSPKVITLSLIYFYFVGALWHAVLIATDREGVQPHQRADRFRHRDSHLFGTIAMILWARHSDATRERTPMSAGRCC
jgi:hypothetical protein